MKLIFDEFVISDEKEMLKLETICSFLSRSYWADKRPTDIIKKSINNSICYGIYQGERQVGFARVVTDWATMYYVCDVFIDEEFRGAGLGKKLIAVITEQFGGLNGLLGTLDGHGLYEKYGFVRNAERLMNRRPT